MPHNEDNTASLSKAEQAVVRQFSANIQKLLEEKPDPVAFLLMRCHALVDVWLCKWIDFINTCEPVRADHSDLLELCPSYQTFFTSCHEKQRLDLNFMGKVKVLNQSGIFPRGILETIRRLNKIRNDYVHNFDYTITNSDIDFILQGLLMNTRYRRLYERKRSSLPDNVSRLNFVLTQILVQLMGLMVTMKSLRRQAFD